MTRQGSGECGSCATTGNTTVAKRLSTTPTPRGARPFTPDTAPSGGLTYCEFVLRSPRREPWSSKGRSREATATKRSRRPAEMTSAVDERGAEASRKFQVLLTASLLSSPIVFASNIVAVSLPSIGWSLESVLRRRPVGDQRLRAYPHQRARDRADARR